jgi:hypothetical protein
MFPAVSSACTNGRARQPCVCGGNYAHMGQICAYGEVCDRENATCRSLQPAAPVPLPQPPLE